MNSTDPSTVWLTVKGPQLLNNLAVQPDEVDRSVNACMCMYFTVIYIVSAFTLLYYVCA